MSAAWEYELPDRKLGMWSLIDELIIPFHPPVNQSPREIIEKT
jgi:hypothetical protein